MQLPYQLILAIWNLDSPTLPRITTGQEICRYVSACFYFLPPCNIIGTIRRLQADRPLCAFLGQIERSHGLVARQWACILGQRIRMEDCRWEDPTMERRHLLAIRSATRLFIRRKAHFLMQLWCRMREWYERVVVPRQKTGQILARNRRDKKEDRVYEIHNDEKRHPFWTSALRMQMEH